MQIEKLKTAVRTGKITWTNHGRTRMEQRGFIKDEVIQIILMGEIIEDYPDSYPYPSCLMCGTLSNNQIVYVVVGYDGNEVYLVTVYVPDEKKFEKNMKTRRKRK